MCSIVLTDVASGFSKHTPIILSDMFGITSPLSNEDYDISCNIFQTLFYSRNANGEIDSDRRLKPYTVKIFDANITDLSQNTDIISGNYQHR